MLKRITLAMSLALVAMNLDAAEPNGLLAPHKTILFLGDSITHAGHYVSRLEAQLRTTNPEAIPVLINLGLPSETCSGLSEPDHPFPRPDVHERIDRALAKVKPDVVFACYGMNDGIYYPFSDERFAAYRKGVNGIIAKVQASGAKLVLMTPPAFDALPLHKKGDLRPAGAEKYAWFAIYEGYDDVLEKYAAWVMTLGDRVDLVIDLHTPVKEYVAAKRQDDADFTMSPDGVHVNEEGHQVLAAAIIKALGVEPIDLDPKLLGLVHARQQILHTSWVSRVGHKRPGVAAGLPLEEAKAKAAEFDRQIRAVE
ncbi:MAG: SGNH/GDSL hydrolase family protein [Planctomycetota bacterium]|nr:SGNH/GDSL hydrolase family protein [Planctomycetota bacterium]